MGYKYSIEDEGTSFVFRLYPNNSNTQAIGVSGQVFKNSAECRRGIEVFKTIIKETDIMEMIDYGKVDDTKWLPKLKKNDSVLIRRELPLTLGKKECIDWALEIKNNIDAEIRMCEV